MLVLSRGQDESVMIGDDLRLTVLRVRGERVLIRICRRNPADRNSSFEESPPAWFDNGREIALGNEMFCQIVNVRAEKVRLGFTLPPNVALHRKEVYDAIKRETRRFT